MLVNGPVADYRMYRTADLVHDAIGKSSSEFESDPQLTTFWAIIQQQQRIIMTIYLCRMFERDSGSDKHRSIPSVLDFIVKEREALHGITSNWDALTKKSYQNFVKTLPNPYDRTAFEGMLWRSKQLRNKDVAHHDIHGTKHPPSYYDIIGLGAWARDFILWAGTAFFGKELPLEDGSPMEPDIWKTCFQIIQAASGINR